MSITGYEFIKTNLTQAMTKFPLGASNKNTDPKNIIGQKRIGSKLNILKTRYESFFFMDRLYFSILSIHSSNIGIFDRCYSCVVCKKFIRHYFWKYLIHQCMFILLLIML